MTDRSKVANHLKKVDKKIHDVFQEVDLGEWFNDIGNNTEMEYFAHLARGIVGQQLSVKAAATINGRVLNLLPSKEWVPEEVLAIESKVLRNAGLSWGKVSYVKDLAQKMVEGELHLGSLDEMSEDEVIEELVTVKGIGVWTAEMFLIFGLGREDVFSLGDAGLRRGLVEIYELDKPTDKDLLAIVEPWSPYKSFGSIALWHSLNNR